MKFLSYICLFVILFSITTGCSSLFKRPDYELQASLKKTSDSTETADSLIDNSTTYQCYYILSRPESKLRISMNAAGNSEELQPYFIAEKYYKLTINAVDLDSYTEIGANHDSDWTIQQPLEIIPSPEDPLIALNTGIYRIRFTVFSEEPFSYTITIGSNSAEVLFAGSLEEARRKLAQALAEVENE